MVKYLLGGSHPIFYAADGIENGMPANYGLFYERHYTEYFRYDFYVNLKEGNIPDKYWIRWHGSNSDISDWMMMPLYPSLDGLASALGVPANSDKLKIFIGIQANSAIEAIQSFYDGMPDQCIFLAHIMLDTQQFVCGYKATNNYGAAFGITYTSTGEATVYKIHNYGGTWTKNDI